MSMYYLHDMKTRQKANMMLKEKGESFPNRSDYMTEILVKTPYPKAFTSPSESASPEEGLRISVLMNAAGKPNDEARLGNSATRQRRKTQGAAVGPAFAGLPWPWPGN